MEDDSEVSSAHKVGISTNVTLSVQEWNSETHLMLRITKGCLPVLWIPGNLRNTRQERYYHLSLKGEN